MVWGQLDARGLTRALVQEINQAWRHLTQRLEGERIYSFAVFTSWEWDELLLTALTEEGLQRSVDRYAKDSPDKPRAELERELRWSYTDSEYHLVFPELDQANRILAEAQEGSAEESWFGWRHRRYMRRVLKCSIRALKSLDRQRVFDVGEARNALVLNIVMGDMSEELWELLLRKLNPPATVARYSVTRELRRRIQARTAQMTRTQKVAYWIGQYVEGAECGLDHQYPTADGFFRSDIEDVLVRLGRAALPAILQVLERCAFEPGSFEDRSNKVHRPPEATPQLRVSDIHWLLPRIRWVDRQQVVRLQRVLGHFVERDRHRKETDTISENLARTLHTLKPRQFPPSSFEEGETNRLANPDAYLLKERS